MIQLQHYSSFLHVVGTLVEIQHTAVCVHVPGTRFILSTLQQPTTTAVVVLQLLALSAACFTLYTAVYIATARPKVHTVVVA